MIYGENDWMDVAGGLVAEEKLREAKLKALLHDAAREKREEKGSAKVVVIPKAGHHIYLDNPDDFNRRYRRRWRRQGGVEVEVVASVLHLCWIYPV
jgi:cardiolipin-specific phospholipase